TMTPPQLTDYLSREIQPQLSALPDVQRAAVEGGSPQAMRIWLDAERLAAFAIAPEEVESALARNNFLSAVGQAKGGAVQVDLLANTDLRSVEEFERLIVREDEDQIIRIADVGTVELGSEEPGANVRYNGQDAVYLSVWPLPGANEIAVAHALRAELAQIAGTLPPGTEIDLAFDGAVYMENALKEIGTTLGETVMIVGLIVFLFLGSVRTALVPLVAIPISLIGATAAMLALGFSLNLLTVLAIVLAVGLVVDDAIVVVENVCRYMREGMGRVEAALTSSRQLFAPIVAMTITLAAVYAPIGFLSGLTGALFKEFVFTLAMAVIMSGIVAVTLSPIMSAYMAPESGREGRFTRMVGYGFDRLRDGYGVVLDGVLRFRAQVLAFGAFICVLAMPLYMFSGKELAPVEDQGVVFLLVTSAPDATLDYTARHTGKVYETGAALPEFQGMFEVVFPSNGFGGYLLQDWHDRERTAHEIQPEVFNALSHIEELQVFAALPPSLPGAGNYDVELVIKGTGTAEEAAGYAAELVGAAFGSGKFMFADTDLKVDLPQVRLVIDRERVADLGLDLAEVGRQLGILLAGDYVNRFTMDGRAYKVIPQVGRDARASAAQLLDYKIQTRDGMQVPFGAVARLETSSAPRTLARFQQADSFRVYGGVVPGVTKSEGLAALEAAARAILPDGYSIDYAGESRQIRQEGST
ncbi:MAG: efflux RND transporter permease subunit, partial [Geminicoccales bacterium]